MYYVYVLKNLITHNYYKGFTKNINLRLEQHKKGYNQSTSYNKEWILIHVDICENRAQARLLEKYFKSGYGREIIKEIDLNLPKW